MERINVMEKTNMMETKIVGDDQNDGETNMMKITIWWR